VFDLGLQELVVIFVIALLVFGPNKLPELARAMGKGVAQLKRALSDIKSEVDVEVKDIENDLKSDINSLKGEELTSQDETVDSKDK
jgi:Tat protein translocase TatB subunit